MIKCVTSYIKENVIFLPYAHIRYSTVHTHNISTQPQYYDRQYDYTENSCANSRLRMRSNLYRVSFIYYKDTLYTISFEGMIIKGFPFYYSDISNLTTFQMNICIMRKIAMHFVCVCTKEEIRKNILKNAIMSHVLYNTNDDYVRLSSWKDLFGYVYAGGLSLGKNKQHWYCYYKLHERYGIIIKHTHTQKLKGQRHLPRKRNGELGERGWKRISHIYE